MVVPTHGAGLLAHAPLHHRRQLLGQARSSGRKAARCTALYAFGRRLEASITFEGLREGEVAYGNQSCIFQMSRVFEFASTPAGETAKTFQGSISRTR